MEHSFWTVFCALILIWYIAFTILVAIKGGRDIKSMVAKWKSEME
ncbi:MAG: hypothetical protein QM485_14640 [Flavobacteriaceae bacterium]